MHTVLNVLNFTVERKQITIQRCQPKILWIHVLLLLLLVIRSTQWAGRYGKWGVGPPPPPPLIHEEHWDGPLNHSVLPHPPRHSSRRPIPWFWSTFVRIPKQLPIISFVIKVSCTYQSREERESERQRENLLRNITWWSNYRMPYSDWVNMVSKSEWILRPK